MDMLQEYQRVADAFVAKMWEHPDVEGVIHLGGIARQRADEYSDIDLAVFSNQRLKWLRTGEQETPEGYDLEVFNIAMDSGFDNWDEIKREAYQEGVIAFDISGRLPYCHDRRADFCHSVAWMDLHAVPQ